MSGPLLLNRSPSTIARETEKKEKKTLEAAIHRQSPYSTRFAQPEIDGRLLILDNEATFYTPAARTSDGARVVRIK